MITPEEMRTLPLNTTVYVIDPFNDASIEIGILEDRSFYDSKNKKEIIVRHIKVPARMKNQAGIRNIREDGPFVESNREYVFLDWREAKSSLIYSLLGKIRFLTKTIQQIVTDNKS